MDEYDQQQDDDQEAERFFSIFNVRIAIQTKIPSSEHLIR